MQDKKNRNSENTYVYFISFKANRLKTNGHILNFAQIICQSHHSGIILDKIKKKAKTIKQHLELVM